MEALNGCPNPSGFIRDLDTGELIPLPCHRWDCPICGYAKKKELLDVIAYGGAVIQQRGQRWRFLTLTLSTKVDGRRIDLFWARFRAILAKHNYHPEYFKVKEFTEKGQRHLHVLISVFIPFNFLQYAWRTATEGTSYWVHIKKAQVKSAAGYMNKYMTKQTVHSGLFDKGERRYSFSYHFPRPAKREKTPSGARYEFVSRVQYMYEQLDAGTWYEKEENPPCTRLNDRPRLPEALTDFYIDSTTSI